MKQSTTLLKAFFVFCLLCIGINVFADNSDETSKPNLQMTYPEAKSKVTTLPDKIIFMFDQEIKSVASAAIQHEYEDPIVIESDKISIADGNSVYIDITDVKDQITAGGITVYCQLDENNQYDTYFTYADEFKPVSSTFDSNGGQIIFNENVDLYRSVSKLTCNVNNDSGEKAATATLTLDDVNFAAINVAFDTTLAYGTYSLVVPAETIISINEEEYTGSIDFTISDPAFAEFVSISPDTSELITIDTEFVVTFSQPVTYVSGYSGINMGIGYSCPSVITQSEDGKVITVGFDKQSLLEAYGCTSLGDLAPFSGGKFTVELYKVKNASTKETLPGNMDEDEEDYTQGTYVWLYSSGDVEPAILEVTPAEGNVTELSQFTFSMSDGTMISPSAKDGADITLADASDNVIATITQDELIEGTHVDMNYNMPISVVVTLPEAITENGRYTLNVPAGAFYHGVDSDASEAFTIKYTISIDGIKTVNKTPGDVRSYNLAGQQVSCSARGILIKNGRKSLNK